MGWIPPQGRGGEGRGGEGRGLVEEIVYRFGVSLLHAVSGTCPRHVAPERYERQEYPRARCSSVRRGCVASGRGGGEREERLGGGGGRGRGEGTQLLRIIFIRPLIVNHGIMSARSRPFITAALAAPRASPGGDQGSSALCDYLARAR